MSGLSEAGPRQDLPGLLANRVIILARSGLAEGRKRYEALGTREIRKGRTVGYLPDMWREFGVAVAGLAGALTGLLFVAVSIKSDALAKSRSLSSRAAQTLALFMISAIAAILLVVPQPRLALGSELLAEAVVFGAALFILDRRGRTQPESGVARYIGRFSPNLVTALLVGIAGLSLILNGGGGLYWMIPAVIASLVGGVINAWLFLIKVPGLPRRG